MSNLGKRINNLLTKLKVDEKSILSAKGETLDDKTLKKISKSKYGKDVVLYNLYKEYIKNGGKKGKFESKKIVITTPFVQVMSYTQEGDMLHTIDSPMQLVHVDVADLNFSSKSAVAPKYCLLCVDMFTSKRYTYGMKKKSRLASKLEKILFETQRRRKYLFEGRERQNVSSNRSRIQPK